MRAINRVNIGALFQPRREKVMPSQFPDLPYIGMEHVEGHTMRLLATVPATNMRSSANRFYKGDVLYGRLRPYLNKVLSPEFEGLCSAEFIVFPKTEGIESKFLKYRLNAEDFVSFASHLNAGDRPRVDFAQLASFEILLPSVSEQRRMVAEIEKQFTRLDAGAASLLRVQAALKSYRASVLKAACEGRLGPSDETGLEPASLRCASPSSLPSGWRWTTPREICVRVVDCHNKTAPYTDRGIALIRTSNVRSGKIDLTDTRFVSRATYEFWSRRCKPEPGDVIFTREAPMGEVGIVPQGATICMGQRMMLMRSSDLILNTFLAIALQSPKLRTYIVRTAVGSGVKHLRVQDVERLPIPLPPLSKQREIAAEVDRRLSAVEELDGVVAVNLKRAERLRQSVLYRAFNGRP